MGAVRYHVIIDLKDVSNDVLSDKEGIGSFLLELADHINMKPLTKPLVVEGVPENPGVTGFVIIDYSHISIHTFTAFNEALIDVFSCRFYDKERAVDECLQHFKVDRSKAKVKVVGWIQEAPEETQVPAQP